MKNSRAQSINEYVFVIALVTAVFVVMQIYIKRGIQGVIKDTADEMGSQAVPFLFNGQLSPQKLGMMERGLVSQTVTTPLQSIYRKDVVTTTSPLGVTDRVITNDVNASQAGFSSVYRIEER